jgi:hypothetical protein
LLIYALTNRANTIAIALLDRAFINSSNRISTRSSTRSSRSSSSKQARRKRTRKIISDRMVMLGT